MEDKFINLCRDGNLKEAKLLHEQHNIDIHTYHNSAFRAICCSGSLDGAKWLHGLGANINAMDDAFRWTCKNGHLEIAEWLHGLGVDIHAKNNLAFRVACQEGHLEIAKWLYDVGVYIHADNDLAFRYACRNGQLETAKWLYDLGANIHTKNDLAFKEACMSGQFKVVDWLLTIDDFDVKKVLNSYSYFSSEIEKLLKQHLEYKLKWCNLFGFNKECTKKFSDIYDNSKKEYSKTFDDMFPFSKVKN